jgi:DNA-binding MarR family transcriptional regulator
MLNQDKSKLHIEKKTVNRLVHRMEKMGQLPEEYI